MIVYGFHHVVPVQVENKELWFRKAIERETMELIFWNFDGQTSKAIKDGAHTAPNLHFLGMTFTTQLVEEQFFIIHAL